MNGFKCNVTSSISTTPIAKSQIPRRCGADPEHNKPTDVPGNCTFGAKQPFYWFQKEQNNVRSSFKRTVSYLAINRILQMFEDTYAPPFYTDLYNFKDGAQDDIFEDSYDVLPVPGPEQTTIPVLASVSSQTSTGVSPEPSPTSGFAPMDASRPVASEDSSINSIRDVKTW